MIRASVLCGLIVITLPAPARAQTAEAIVARHMAARGGGERWQAVRTLRLTGRAVAGPGREALVTREIKRPGKVRTEFTFQGTTGVFAYDGTHGWQVSPLTGVIEPQRLEADNSQVAAEQADLDGGLVSAAEAGASVTLVGREPIAGRDAFHLRVTPKAGRPHDHWLDAETYLLVRSESTRQVRGHIVVTETTFGDYRAIGGLVLPHEIELGARGRPQRVRIVLNTVEVNPRIEDSRFRMPAGTRR